MTPLDPSTPSRGRSARPWRLHAALVSLAALACVACDGGGGGSDAGGGDAGGGAAAPGCDLRAVAMYCQDYAYGEDVLPAYEDSCRTNGGTWLAAGCPRADALGGCRSVDATFGASTTWFYVGGPYMDAAQVRMLCESGAGAGTYVDP
ncbi:MAG: hypothetical protein KF729_04875 [Sandaracinaceae bacterium]|nr:hypothetical protein [Sandaracinaceae bacterium]